jgi:hypothetical protein
MPQKDQPTQKMTSEAFHKLLKDYIVPMFPGAKIRRQPAPRRALRRNAMLLNPQLIRVRWPAMHGRQFGLKRSQAFGASDADLVDAIVEEWIKGEVTLVTTYCNDLATAGIRTAIARIVAPQHWELVDSVIRRLEQWSDQTYEGRAIAAALGIDTSRSARSGVDILKLLTEKFGLVMAHGLESFLTVARNGRVIGYDAPQADGKTECVLAPWRFVPLAQWSSDGKVGLALTRNGEILVFKNQALMFARRRGSWRHFPHKAMISRARLNRSLRKELVTAAYTTALDVSFAKTGGGLGIIRKRKAKAFQRARVLKPKDSPVSTGVKGLFLKRLLGAGTFVGLDRKLRLELVAIDGSTIISHEGGLLGAGAILKIKAGSRGGGREAAARTLGEFGLGIKISSDGEITGYTEGEKGISELFTVG